MHNLTPNVLTKRLVPDATAATTWTLAAGTTDVNSPGVDMLGYVGIRFIMGLGTITSGAVTSIKLQQSDDDGAADDYTDLTGTGITIADTDDNKLIITEIWKPLKRYVRLALDRGTQNAVIDFLMAELHNPINAGVTKDATVATQEIANGPGEGTA